MQTPVNFLCNFLMERTCEEDAEAKVQKRSYSYPMDTSMQDGMEVKASPPPLHLRHMHYKLNKLNTNN